MPTALAQKWTPVSHKQLKTDRVFYIKVSINVQWCKELNHHQGSMGETVQKLCASYTSFQEMHTTREKCRLAYLTQNQKATHYKAAPFKGVHLWAGNPTIMLETLDAK